MIRNIGKSAIVASSSNNGINGPSVQRPLGDDAPHLISCLWDITLLIKRGLVKPLGRPGPNGDKFFATVTLSKLRQDEQWLSRATQAVNTHLTETYWQIGHDIVEFEQGGKTRADYGTGLLASLSRD